MRPVCLEARVGVAGGLDGLELSRFSSCGRTLPCVDVRMHACMRACMYVGMYVCMYVRMLQYWLHMRPCLRRISEGQTCVCAALIHTEVSENPRSRRKVWGTR